MRRFMCVFFTLPVHCSGFPEGIGSYLLFELRALTFVVPQLL